MVPSTAEKINRRCFRFSLLRLWGQLRGLWRVFAITTVARNTFLAEAQAHLNRRVARDEACHAIARLFLMPQAFCFLRRRIDNRGRGEAVQVLLLHGVLPYCLADHEFLAAAHLI